MSMERLEHEVAGLATRIEQMEMVSENGIYRPSSQTSVVRPVSREEYDAMASHIAEMHKTLKAMNKLIQGVLNTCVELDARQDELEARQEILEG